MQERTKTLIHSYGIFVKRGLKLHDPSVSSVYFYFPLQTDIKNNMTAAPAAKTNIVDTSEKILCAALSENLRSQIFVLDIAYGNRIAYNMYRKRDIKFDMLISRHKGARRPKARRIWRQRLCSFKSTTF